MPLWLNMSNQNAELCYTNAEGVRKLENMLAIRRREGAKIEPNVAAAEGVRYVVISERYGQEDFWLSEGPESKKLG